MLSLGMLENLKYQDIETFFVIIFALLFVALERYFPKHKNLEVKSHLKLDIAAFVLIIISVNISRLAASTFFDQIHFKALGIMEATQTWPFLVKIILAHFISDFILYWIHRGMHNNNFLWKTHKFHHSAEALYWFSGFRTSFMHAFIYAFPQVMVGFYLFNFSVIELGLGFSFGVFSNFFTHSNYSLPAWLPLHYILVTPDFHHPHHSQMGTQNKNFGNVFSVWDRLFGTYVAPEKIRSDFKYGLKEKPATWRMMIGL